MADVRGEEVALRPVPVVVHGWTIREWRADELDVEIRCGGGTYVRALARDLGRAVGSAAHLTRLRRTQSGPFGVADAVDLDGLRQGRATLAPPVRAVASLPTQVCDELDVVRLCRGIAVQASLPGERAALIDAGGDLVAVAERSGDRWQPRVVLRDG